MPSTVHTDTINASADEVYALFSAFGDNRWMRVEVSIEGEGEGAIRKVTLPSGVATEVCEVLDPATRTMQYGLIDGNPFPCTDYHGRMSVTPIDDDSCTLEWSSTYEADDPEGVNAQLAEFLKGAAGALKRYAENNRP